MQHRATIVVYKLCGAAADLHDKSARNFHRVDYALVHVVRFLFLPHNRHADARCVVNVGKKSFLVACTTHRRRSYGKDTIDIFDCAQLFEGSQSGDCLHNSRLLEASVGFRFAKADGFATFLRNNKVTAVKNVIDYKSRGI